MRISGFSNQPTRCWFVIIDLRSNHHDPIRRRRCAVEYPLHYPSETLGVLSWTGLCLARKRMFRISTPSEKAIAK
jgi:hypothetical protein